MQGSPEPESADFLTDVLNGLARRPRAIPPKYFYDQRGSQLFDQICETAEYGERIKANPTNRDKLMAMDPKKFVAVLTRWRDLFVAGAQLPVFGVSEAQLNSIKLPTIIIPV